MTGNNITIDELRNLSNELTELRRALILGRNELKARNEINPNQFDGMGRAWLLVNDMFEAIRLRAFTTITSDLSSVTSRLHNSMRRAAIVIAAAQDAVNTLQLSISVFKLLDELLVALQENIPAAIAGLIDEIDALAQPIPTILLPDPPIRPFLPPPPNSPAAATAPSAAASSRLNRQRIIQDVDISRQFYYELTPRRLAMLDLIAWAEGTDREIGNTRKGYDIIFTFATFSDFSRHPRRQRCAGSLCSDAAGRYQFLSTTWDLLQGNLSASGFTKFPSFEPDYQDQAALYDIDWKRNVMKAVDEGDFEGFLMEGAKEWASLPFPPTGQSYYGQGTAFSISDGRAIYNELFDLWNAPED